MYIVYIVYSIEHKSVDCVRHPVLYSVQYIVELLHNVTMVWYACTISAQVLSNVLVRTDARAYVNIRRPEYASPELLKFNPAARVGPEVDIWSLYAPPTANHT